MQEVLLYILGVVVIFLGIAISIALHEIGHLVPAKKFGVYVDQYMVGFGPTLWSTKRGETEYGIKAIPLGGYISMAGMFPPEVEGEVRKDRTSFASQMVQDAEAIETIDIDPSRSFVMLPALKRIIIMLGGPIMNLVLGLGLFTILVVGFGLPQQSTTVSSVSECVIRVSEERFECLDTDPKAPAYEAGIQPGDTLISWNGTEITSWAQISSLISESGGRSIQLVVERDGALRNLVITPMITERYAFDENGNVIVDEDGNYVTVERGFAGITSLEVRVQGNLLDSVELTGRQTNAVVGVILDLPSRLVNAFNAAFGAEERDPNGPMSIVGVGRIAGEITSYDGLDFTERAAGIIGILGALNIALFVFNMIPLLPLDGGHIVAAMVDGGRRTIAKIRKKPAPTPVNLAKLMPLTVAVASVLILMTILLVYADIVRPISLF
ncbi:MAG: site-2 protease family protein [Microbacteriaceae bacterium]|nr:site-2 protease family protein [Microbacteriaceae bacterium]